MSMTIARTAYVLDAKALRNAAKALKPFLARRPVRPILGSYLLHIADETIWLTATDLDKAASIALHDPQAEGHTPFPGIVIPPAALEALPKSGPVEISLEGLTLRVGAVGMETWAADDFPKLPYQGSDDDSCCSRDTLRRIFSRSPVCATPEGSTARATLTTIGFVKGEAWATDGFHVYYHQPTDAGRLLQGMNIPAAFAEAAARLLDRAGSLVYAHREGNRLTLSDSGGVRLNTRLHEGQYPDVASLIPKNFPCYVIANLEPLTEAISEVARLTKKVEPHIVELREHAAGLELVHARGSDANDLDWARVVEAEWRGSIRSLERNSGKPADYIGFDAALLLSGLKLHEGTVAVLEFSGIERISRMSLSTDSTYYQMPLNLPD